MTVASHPTKCATVWISQREACKSDLIWICNHNKTVCWWLPVVEWIRSALVNWDKDRCVMGDWHWVAKDGRGTDPLKPPISSCEPSTFQSWMRFPWRHTVPLSFLSVVILCIRIQRRMKNFQIPVFFLLQMGAIVLDDIGNNSGIQEDFY